MIQTIALSQLFYLFIPLLFVGVVYARWTGSRFEMAYATGRMLIQLIAIGYVLIFIFSNKQLWLGLLILLFMLSLSAVIIFRNTRDKTRRNFTRIFMAVGLSSVINLVLVIFVVLEITHFYEPRYVIPLAGMILSNAMNGISLAVERFEEEYDRHTNATPHANTVFVEARRIAFKAAMIPQINALLAVGLVALPGMMTGQILSGIDPLIAVRYQILIMIISLSGAGMSIIFYFILRSADEV